jgi:hypothetical protein
MGVSTQRRTVCRELVLTGADGGRETATLGRECGSQPPATTPARPLSATTQPVRTSSAGRADPAAQPVDRGVCALWGGSQFVGDFLGCAAGRQQ